MDLLEDNHLAHHGVKGQKWGLRRFQNEDGTLTKEGRERYYKHLDKDDKENNKRLSEAPEELKFHIKNKESLIRRGLQNGQSKNEAEAWHNARKKYLENEIKYAPRDKIFNKKMRKFLDKKKDITVSDLRKAIFKNAKKAKLDADWVTRYYDENLEGILHPSKNR